MVRSSFILIGLATLLMGCTHKIEAPDKPIVINMNMKIDHKVRVKVQKDLNKAKKEHPEIFA